MRRSLLVLALLGSCASSPMPEVRSAFSSGNYQRARELLLEAEGDDPSNSQVYRLERGIVEIANGTPAAAVAALRPARDRLDELGGIGVGEWFTSVLLDDRQLDYTGYDYEKVLVRAVLAVADLMQGGRDADAYALQVLEKQQEIVRTYKDAEGKNPKMSYKLVAFGTYLRAILNEEKPLNRELAMQCMQRAVELEPRFANGKQDLERLTDGKHSERGNGVVHVIAFVGRGPYRVETAEQVSGALLAYAQLIWATIRDRVTFPNITSVKIPTLAFHRDNPTSMFVAVDGQSAGTTAIITDVEETAMAEFRAMRDSIVARAVIRRAFKIGVTEGVKEIGKDPSRDSPRRDDPRSRERQRRDRQGRDLLDLGISIAGLIWTALEEADLRCWSLLPATIQVQRLELPAGAHELSLRAGKDQPTGTEQRVLVDVRDGFNTYVFVMAPTLQGGPPPLTSHLPQPPRESS